MTPLHTGTVNGSPVRFFRSPIEDGRADLPWMAWDDLTAAFPLPANVQAHFRQSLRTDWPDVSRTIATITGPVVVVPHFAGKGFIGAMVECLRIDAEVEYTKSATKALDALMGDRPFDAVIRYVAVALHRWDDDKGGTA